MSLLARMAQLRKGCTDANLGGDVICGWVAHTYDQAARACCTSPQSLAVCLPWHCQVSSAVATAVAVPQEASIQLFQATWAPPIACNVIVHMMACS